MKSLGKTQDLLVANLKSLMEKRGWKPKDLAEATGLSLQAIYNITKAERFPGPDNLDRIAEAFRLRVADLFETSSQSREISSDEILVSVEKALKLASNPLLKRIAALPKDEQDMLEKRVDMVEHKLKSRAHQESPKIAK